MFMDVIQIRLSSCRIGNILRESEVVCVSKYYMIVRLPMYLAHKENRDNTDSVFSM